MNDNSVGVLEKGTPRLLASYLLPLSLFALAGSIVYFTYQVAMVSKQIPDILQRIDTTSENIEPIIGEVSQIIDLVPLILKEVEETRKLVPPILKEVEQTRKMIPPILVEVEQTRNQIPAVLKESEAIRGELPAMLASADKASDAVSDVSRQVEATRPLIPEVLKEVETTRESIPPMMDRADQLIDKARVAGKEASQGAVTGVFSGLFMAPFALMSDAGAGITGMTKEEAKNYSEKDFKLNQDTSLVMLNTGVIGQEKKWENPESGNHGIVKLIDIYKKGEFADIDCRTLSIQFYQDGVFFKEGDRSFCKNDEGKWTLDE